MSELHDIFERAELESLLQYLIYEVGSLESITEDYEQKIDNSFDVYLKKMKLIYPDIEKEDDEVFNVVANLATTHDEIYFATGVLVGFQLYKNMDQRYVRLRDGDIQAILNKAKSLR